VLSNNHTASIGEQGPSKLIGQSNTIEWMDPTKPLLQLGELAD
jgi:hypothetical protein